MTRQSTSACGFGRPGVSWFVRAVLVAWLALVCVPQARALADDLRTWSDASGKFKIKAKFVAVENGVVTLEDEQGMSIEIELKKLSAADQRFIAEAQKAAENPFKAKSKAKAKDDDPFKKKTTSSKPAKSKPRGDDADAGETRTAKVNLAAAEQISLTDPLDAWQVNVPDHSESRGFTPKSAPLPPKSNFFEGLKGLAVNMVAKKAAAGFIVAQPGTPGTTRVVVCDLATGKTSAPATASGQMVPLALHDDGRQIVMRRDEFGFGNLDRLEVWTIDGKSVNRSVIWTPYEADQGGPRDVMWGEFLDEEHLATSSRAGKVVIWKFPEIEPECWFSLADGAIPALSPDRSLIGWSNGKEVGLFEVAKRQVIARQPTPLALQWPYMAFSPTGKKLGCVAFDKVLVWDVPTGQLERTIPCPGINVHGAIDFPDDGYVLANGKFLIDTGNLLKLWTYEGHEQVRSAAGWTFLGVTDGDKKPGALVAARIPHAAAKDIQKKALGDPNLWILKAGTTVKINVSGVTDASQRDRVQQALAKRLQAIDCQAGAGGSIELAAFVEGPKDREVSFIAAGTYKTKEYITRVRFVHQGQAAWETSGTNVPFVVSLKQGENIEGELRAREKPEYGFFDTVELPKFLQKPVAGQGAGGSLTLGQSRVTTAGVK